MNNSDIKYNAIQLNLSSDSMFDADAFSELLKGLGISLKFDIKFLRSLLCDKDLYL